MENIDDFMKKKMLDDAAGGGQRFEFREEYWLQAESLIVAQEQRKRRRRFFWWLSSGFLLLAFAVGAWYAWLQPNTGEQSGLSASSDMPRTTATQLPAGDTLYHPAAAPQTGNTYTSPATTSSTENKQPGFTQTQGASSNPANAGHRADNAASLPQKATAHSTSGRNQAGSPRAGAASFKGSSTDLQPAKTGPASAVSSVEKTETAVPGTADKQALTSEPAAGNGTTTPQPAFEGSDNKPLTLPQLLPTLLRYLQPVPPRLPAGSTAPPEPVAQTNKPPDADRKFHLGIMAFGSAYAPAASTQRWGAGAGISASWRLGNAWSVQVSPMWRMRTMGAFTEEWQPQNSSQLRYSFGYELSEYSLEGTATHWLEIPVGVQWRHLPWTAEAGIAPGHLLVVQGRKATATEDSFTPRKTTREWVKLDQAPFYKNYVAVYAGGRFALTNRLSLGVRVYYLGGDFRRQSPEYTPPRQTIWVDAGLHCTLF